MMAKRDPVVVQPSEDTAVNCTVTGPPDNFTLDGAVFNGTHDDKVQLTEAGISGRKKRRRKKAKCKVNPHSEIADETPHSPSPEGYVALVGPSSVAHLLRNARDNWGNTCHLLMGEVSLKDKKILGQIIDLINRLGTEPDHTTMTHQRVSSHNKETTALETPSAFTAKDGINIENLAALKSPNGQAGLAPNLRQNENEDGIPAVPQEDEEERQARLNRITSRLMLKWKERPFEGQQVTHRRATSTDEESLETRGPEQLIDIL